MRGSLSFVGLASMPFAALPLSAQDCAGWNQREPAREPEGDGLPSMTYDDLRRVTVMHTRPNPAEPITWEWAGDNWTLRVEKIQGPPFATEMVFDSVRGFSVTFGGSSTSFLPENETWEWDGSAWTERLPPWRPDHRYLHGMAFDSARGVTVVFGGQFCDDNNPCFSYGDTWEYDGKNWTERLIPGPGPRHTMALAYDSARAVTVLYGGITAAGRTDETWEYDGQEWTLVDIGGPGKRAGHSMVFDTDRAVTFLFGGRNANGNYENDLWEWDGQAWTEVPTNERPLPRQHAGLAYDSAREVIVMFGGENVLGENLSDTWEFSCAPPCPPDLDGNLKLDLFDFLAFLNLFNAEDPKADCDQNGALDLFDFLCFVNAFNEGC